MSGRWHASHRQRVWEGFSEQPCLSPSQTQAPLTHAPAQRIPAKVPTTHTEGLSIPRALTGRGCPRCQGQLKLWRDQSTEPCRCSPSLPAGRVVPSQRSSECMFEMVTSFLSLFFPLPSDNSFWDVIRTTKQPKTTRAPPKHNPGKRELPSPPQLHRSSAASAGRAFGMAVLPLALVFPASSLFVHMRQLGKKKNRKPHGGQGISALPCTSLGVSLAPGPFCLPLPVLRLWACSPPRHSAVQHSTAPHSTAPHSTATLGSTGTPGTQAQGTLSAGCFAACSGRVLAIGAPRLKKINNRF